MQTARDRGKSSQDTLISLMHMHLKVQQVILDSKHSSEELQETPLNHKTIWTRWRWNQKRW